MKSKKYLGSCAMFLYSFVLPQLVVCADIKKVCGEYHFAVKIFNESEFYGKEFELYYQVPGHEKKMFYRTERAVNLNAACVKNDKNKYFMVFLESYGGNATPEEVYGIFDPDLNKLLVKPADNGYKNNPYKIEKILGFYPPSPKYSGNEDVFFCCGLK